MSEFDKAEEKAWREYIRTVGDNLAGPSSLFGNGFKSGTDYEKKRAEGEIKFVKNERDRWETLAKSWMVSYDEMVAKVD
jgi:hypothetical protein